MRNTTNTKPRTGRTEVATLAVLLVTAVLLAGCGGNDEGTTTVDDRDPVSLEIAAATVVPLERATAATGTVEPWARVSPGTKILGRIAEVPVREGDRVVRGQVLAELESRDLDAAVAQSKAALTMADANLENAEAQHRRMVDLHGRKSVTEKNLEDAVAAFRVAEASVAQARANLTAAEVTRGYAEIRSPVDGWITEKRAEAGDIASPGVPMFVIEDLSRVKVNLEVPESDVVGLEVGAPARIGIDVLERSWDAAVDRLVPSGDPTSRTYRVQLVLDNDDGLLKSGMFARARFARGTREALLVPASSLVRRGQLEGLFVVDADGRARLRWVRVRQVSDDDTRLEVMSGLAPGERYVVSPPPGLTDATPVVTG